MVKKAVAVIVSNAKQISMFLAEVKSRTQGSRPRPRTQKNQRPRPDPLEAGDQRASVFQKKKVFAQKHSKFSRKFRSSPKKIKKGFHKVSTRSLACSKTKNKYGHDLGQFSTYQKIVPFSSRGLADFEAKDFKLCPRGLHLWFLVLFLNRE